jgi:hypothetical protein
VVNNGSANALLENMGGGVFLDVAASPVDDAGDGYSATWADYDNDGDPDIYLVNDGPNRLFRNDGVGFSDVTFPPLNDAGNGRGAAWADYDNDGDLDLYLANSGSSNKLFRNDGLGSFSDVTVTPLGDTGSGMGVSWIDFNNDGNLDLYLANSASANKIFRNRGDGTFQDATVVPLGGSDNGAAVACADYDADGLVDVYVASTGGANLLFHNEYQPGNHWLQVELVGTTSNTSGIGSRVRVVTEAGTQIREAGAGSGYCSQNSGVLAFGLRGTSVVDTLEITWPTGMVWDTVMVAADQRLTFTEYDISGVAGKPAATTPFGLRTCRPNPFDECTDIRYALAKRSTVQIRIYDVSGRAIRTLADSETQGPGEHSVAWDGRNEQGIRVSSGIYFCRLEAGALRATRSMALLR